MTRENCGNWNFFWQTAGRKQLVLKLFVNTREAADGRWFIVKSPFKQPQEGLGEGYTQTACSFLTRTPSDCKAWAVWKLDPSWRNSWIWTILKKSLLIHKKSAELYNSPHPWVFWEDSITAKLRVVSHGSAKMSNDQSLNERLMVDAKLQPDLYSTLLCFRFDKVALTVDVPECIVR